MALDISDEHAERNPVSLVCAVRCEMDVRHDHFWGARLVRTRDILAVNRSPDTRASVPPPAVSYSNDYILLRGGGELWAEPPRSAPSTTERLTNAPKGPASWIPGQR